jgi:hypothetical protein
MAAGDRRFSRNQEARVDLRLSDQLQIEHLGEQTKALRQVAIRSYTDRN